MSMKKNIVRNQCLSLFGPTFLIFSKITFPSNVTPLLLALHLQSYGTERSMYEIHDQNSLTETSKSESFGLKNVFS